MTIMTPTKRVKAKVFNCIGWPQCSIATLFKVDTATITRTLQDMKEHPDPYYKKPKPGRPRKMDKRDVRRATRAITSDFASDATDLQCKMFPSVSPQVVRRRLTEAGFPGRIC